MNAIVMMGVFRYLSRMIVGEVDSRMSVVEAGDYGLVGKVYPYQCGVVCGLSALLQGHREWSPDRCADEPLEAGWGNPQRSSARLPCVGGVRAASELLDFGRSGVAG